MRLTTGRGDSALEPMKTKQTGFLFGLAFLLLLGACRSKESAITPLQRKEADNIVKEALFAITVRDYPRAQGLMDKAVQMVPDAPDYRVTLGTTHFRQGKREEAKAAYKAALEAYENLAKRNDNDAQSRLQQVYVLTLLGRVDEARAMLAKIASRYPADKDVRMFVDGKQIDQLLANPKFKEIAF